MLSALHNERRPACSCSLACSDHSTFWLLTTRTLYPASASASAAFTIRGQLASCAMLMRHTRFALREVRSTPVRHVGAPNVGLVMTPLPRSDQLPSPALGACQS